MKKSLLYLAGFAAVFLLVCAALFQISKSRTFQFFGEIYPRVETRQKLLALTFGDGPSAAKTDQILPILREENVKATFYLIGAEIEKKSRTNRKNRCQRSRNRRPQLFVGPDDFGYAVFCARGNFEGRAADQSRLARIRVSSLKQSPGF